MTLHPLGSHLFRVWKRHWALQVATVSVMTLVLVMLNLLTLGYTAFDRTVDQWGRGLEMTVYLKDGVSTDEVAHMEHEISASGDFAQVRYVDKPSATRKFLTALGGDSLELLNDPKWMSPIPATFELRLSEQGATDRRLQRLHQWSARLRDFEVVDDVFYGQGWVENFSRFISSAKGAVVLFWALGLSVGLLIVGNCIRLSFLQRREEIEVLELVGATTGFIRTPFLVEGMAIGLVSSLLSLALSYTLHSFLLGWAGQAWNFWFAFKNLPALSAAALALNLISGVAFGVLGAWNCVRKLNTGWAAAS